MYRVRTVTIFAKISEWKLESIESEMSERLSRYREALSEAARRFGVEIWTRRLSMPETPLEVDVKEYAGTLDSLMKRNDMNYVTCLNYSLRDLASRSGLAEEVVEALHETERTFASFHVSAPMDYRLLYEYTKFISMAYETLEPESMARIGLVFNGPLETPYFPGSISSNRSWSVSAALLYVDEVRDRYQSSGDLEASLEPMLRDAVAVVKWIGETFKLKPLGVDASLSPWMSESVVTFIEELGGIDSLSSLGALHAVATINRALSRLAARMDLIGFNEVMIAVAEDNRAKEEVLEGKVNIQTLLALSAVCMNGIDMVVLPYDEYSIYSLLADSAAVAEVKGRPYGFRIIPVSSKPGDVVDLGRFGPTPVISL